tara:strand:- start:371 stop:1183 length:813 start_codon:yes stop_codon:yes gene_type:complete
MSIEERRLLTEKVWRLRSIPSENEVWIDSQFIVDSRSVRPPSISERYNRGLVSLVRNIPQLGKSTKLKLAATEFLEFVGASFSVDEKEAISLLGEYRDRGLINLFKAPVGYAADLAITLKGHLEVERANSTPSGDHAFVAMWFAKQMDEVFEKAVDPAVRDCGYIPFRVDRKEHNNKIDDEIIAGIRKSSFLIADFTSEPNKPRGGVYYEAGFAQGLGLPVIWTCRLDLISDVHFDTRQFNHITWESVSEFRTKLTNRILATIGKGPHAP